MTKQAIAAGHEETLATAKLILQEGGNAFDAAIAAYLSMFITEPCMASAGAGGFAMCYTPKKGVEMLDFFTQTPLSKPKLDKRDFYPIKVNFGNEVETFHVGLASAATPGAIAGIYELHRRYGSMPMSTLIQPAMKLAKEGLLLNTFQALDLTLLEAIFRVDPSVKSVFFNGDELKKEGELLHFPHFADFLEFLNSEGANGFYKGEISKVVANDSLERGGYLRRSDFENYKAIWRKPLIINGKYKVCLPNAPSLGGAIMALLLHFKKEFEGDFTNAMAHVKTHCSMPAQLEEGIRLNYPDFDFSLKNDSKATKGTSHFNIIDKYGNAIALTSTIGEGSGYFIPGTDMQMNNMLGEDFLLPNGFHSWQSNVRLNSMMTPTIVLDTADQFKYAGGSGGAGRIPYMIAQVIDNLFEQNMSLQSATERGRIHYQDGVLHFEKGAKFREISNGIELNEWNEQSLFFGGVHSIYHNKEGRLQAQGDARRYGVAEVF